MSCLSFIGDKNSNKPKLTISNTQLNEDNQLVEEHPDVCDEESEERSELFFSVTSKWWRQKKKKKKIIWTYLKQLLIFISRKKTREKTSEFVVELS